MNTPYRITDAPVIDFPEVGAKSSKKAIVLGMAVIGLSIYLGRSYAFYFGFLAFALFITLLWNKAPRPWIFLASIAAATPIALFKQQFTCNLIFAF